jgi:acylphosphatase
MNRCLKITFSTSKSKEFLDSVIKKSARDLGIEGTVQALGSESINIFACSSKETLEDFLDVLHKEEARGLVQDIVIQPFLKNKDYRGVFRVID